MICAKFRENRTCSFQKITTIATNEPTNDPTNQRTRVIIIPPWSFRWFLVGASFHWLHVPERILVKVAELTYRAANGSAPA